MATHDLSFDVSQNGMAQPPSYDQQQMAMSGTMDGGMAGGMAGGMTGNGSNGGGMLDRLKTESAHPTVCIFHCIFKFSAMFLYIFGGWFTGNGQGGTSGSKFIMVAVLCILLLASDFWVVKNITGRLLVGLRWWNKVEGETTRWIFECADTLPNGSTIQRNKFDANIFWTVLYMTPVIWGALLIFGLLKFQIGWLIIVIMALCLSSANVYGYYKCSNDQKARFQQMMQSGAQTGALAIVKSSILGALTGSPSNSNNSNGAANGNTYTYR